jgi:copper chaperone CopZ
MRQFGMAAVALLAAGALQAAAQDGKKAEIKGPHICCGACEKSVNDLLAKVEGVAEVKCDRKNKTVTFTAKDMKAAQKALEALFDGGFAGTGHYGDVAFEATTSAPAEKANEVTVKNVHACCPQCHKALQKLFDGAKVTITGSGPQRDVTVGGDNLSGREILEKLNKAGFNGKIEKK